jgi:hypothetical protein
MKKILFALFITIVTLSSCQKDPEVGGTAVQAMAGEWWLQIDGEGDYYHFSTYNTAANSSTEMWIDDLGSFWSADGSVKGKVAVNLADLSFSGANIENADPEVPITFSIESGKIIQNGAIGPVSKAVTDSISFIAEFSDDPGTKYNLSGYRRTRFSEDDH